MSDSLTLDEIARTLARMEDKLDAINGKVQAQDVALARHDEQLKAVRRQSAGWGSAAGGFVGGLIGVVGWLWGQK